MRRAVLAAALAASTTAFLPRPHARLPTRRATAMQPLRFRVEADPHTPLDAELDPELESELRAARARAEAAWELGPPAKHDAESRPAESEAERLWREAAALRDDAARGEAALRAARVERARARAREQFRALDADGDGVVTADDLSTRLAALTGAPRDVSRDEAVALAHLVGDADGALRQDDWLRIGLDERGAPARATTAAAADELAEIDPPRFLATVVRQGREARAAARELAQELARRAALMNAASRARSRVGRTFSGDAGAGARVAAAAPLLLPIATALPLTRPIADAAGTVLTGVAAGASDGAVAAAAASELGDHVYGLAAALASAGPLTPLVGMFLVARLCVFVDERAADSDDAIASAATRADDTTPLLVRFNALQAIDLELAAVAPTLALAAALHLAGIDTSAVDAVGAAAGGAAVGAAALAALATLATGTPPTVLGPISARAFEAVELKALETEIRASSELANSTIMIVPRRLTPPGDDRS